MGLEHAAEWLIGYLNGKVGEVVPVAVLGLIMPQLLKLANIDRADARARAEVQAAIDEALRKVGAI